MSLFIRLAVLITALVSFSFAGLDVKIATASDISSYDDGIDGLDPDTNYVSSNWGAAQYRFNGMRALRDGVWDHFITCVDNVDFSKGSRPLSTGLPPIFENYVAYAITEDFTVPEDGDYNFRVRRDVFAFVIIDGKLLVNTGNKTPPETTTVFKNWPYEVIGTFSTLTTDGTHQQTYDVEGINLSAGSHKLEIYYSYFAGATENTLELYWQKPGDADYSIIPASAFGEVCPAPPSAEITSLMINGEEKTNLSLTYDVFVAGCDPASVIKLTADLLNKQEWAGDLSYEWNLGDGNSVSTDTNSIEFTYEYASAEGWPYTPSVTITHSDVYAYSSNSDLKFNAKSCNTSSTIRISGKNAFVTKTGISTISNALVINNASADVMKIALYDMTGRLINTYAVDAQNSTTLNNLHSGLYIAKSIVNGKTLEAQSFVIK